MIKFCSEHNKQHTAKRQCQNKILHPWPHITLWVHIHKQLYGFMEFVMFLNLSSTHMKWKRLNWCGRLLGPPPCSYSWLPGYPYLHPQSLCYLHPPPWSTTVTPVLWGRRLQLTERRRTWHSCKAQIPFRSLIQEGCHRKLALTRDREAHRSQTSSCIRQHAPNTIKAGS